MKSVEPIRNTKTALIVLTNIASATFYVVNFALPIVLLCSGYPQFFWIGPLVNLTLISWLILAPLACISGFLRRRFTSLVCVALVCICFVAFRASIIPAALFAYILPVCAALFLFLPLREFRILRTSRKLLGCGKHPIGKQSDSTP